MNKIDRKILLPVIALVFSGVFIFLSSSLIYLKNPNSFTNIFVFQLIAIFLGLIAIYIIQKNRYFNYLTIKNNSIYLFTFSLILQLSVLVPFLGVTKNGSTRWLDLGIITIQPSELFRFSAILFFANIIFILSKTLRDFKTFTKFIIVPVFLISIFYYYIRDLGSLMIFLTSLFSMLLFSGVNKKKLILFSFISFFILLSFAWFFSDHARQRLKDFVYPEQADITGSFYQNYNMMTAIGSGKLYGVGYGQSLQKFNGSIPEGVSDSIFSIFAEEFGFLGSSFLVILYLYLAYVIFLKIKYIKNKYQKLVVVGLGINLIFPAFYNIATTISLVPLSGIPLTFISKGGTSIFFSLISVGIILLFTKK